MCECVCVCVHVCTVLTAQEWTVFSFTKVEYGKGAWYLGSCVSIREAWLSDSGGGTTVCDCPAPLTHVTGCLLSQTPLLDAHGTVVGLGRRAAWEGSAGDMWSLPTSFPGEK